MELTRLEQHQQKLTDRDPIKEKLEELFVGKVGGAPKDQGEVDEIYKQGEVRFQLKIPPGYLDTPKNKSSSDEYSSGGILYKRKFGDYLVWRQILAYAKDVKIEAVIFVTDDLKDDWWQIVEASGSKTIGPRPELVDEAKRLASIDTFLMYTPVKFLEYASGHLKTNVSVETLEDVSLVSKAQMGTSGYKSRFTETKYANGRLAFEAWLNKQFDMIRREPTDVPSLVGLRDGCTFGFELLFIDSIYRVSDHLTDSVYRILTLVRDKSLDELALVWIVDNADHGFTLKHILGKMLLGETGSNLRIIIGMVIESARALREFLPIYEWRISRSASSEI